MADPNEGKTNQRKFTWDINDVEFEPGSGNGQPLVPDSMKEEAKRRLRQSGAAIRPMPDPEPDTDQAAEDRWINRNRIR